MELLAFIRDSGITAAEIRTLLGLDDEGREVIAGLFRRAICPAGQAPGSDPRRPPPGQVTSRDPGSRRAAPWGAADDAAAHLLAGSRHRPGVGDHDRAEQISRSITDSVTGRRGPWPAWPVLPNRLGPDRAPRAHLLPGSR